MAEKLAVKQSLQKYSRIDTTDAAGDCPVLFKGVHVPTR